MKSITIAALLMLACSGIHAQPFVGRKASARSIYSSDSSVPRDQPASFPGDLNEYLRVKFRYPDDSRENSEQGRAELLFEITEDGHVLFISVRKSAGSSSLESEVRRVITTMPRWKPARKKGRRVRSLLVVPVEFRIESTQVGQG